MNRNFRMSRQNIIRGTAKAGGTGFKLFKFVILMKYGMGISKNRTLPKTCCISKISEKGLKNLNIANKQLEEQSTHGN